MKAQDWHKAAQLVCERKIQVALANTSDFSSFSLSELPTVIHGKYVPLSTSKPVHTPSNNQQGEVATQEEKVSFRQVIPNIPSQS